MKQRPEPLIWDAVVRGGKIAMVNQQDYLARAKKAAAKWGAGTALKIRIEPEEDAYHYSDLKHLFGHFFRPFSEYTGDTMHEVKAMFKALFLPEGKTSITELSREELRDFTEQVEAFIWFQLPEALERSDYGVQ